MPPANAPPGSAPSPSTSTPQAVIRSWNGTPTPSSKSCAARSSPHSDGDLAQKPRHALDAYAFHGTDPGRRPALRTAERVSLLAIGFTALTARSPPSTPPLCDAIDEALTLAAVPALMAEA
ncbi:hypothetical protein [Kitasatospora terrestris]|uniref:Uncharacterized protein n=1 Tax=Kitasatospora terrestris TaxID=258051 RepID=A0ABP9DFZ7_9ACTN